MSLRKYHEKRNFNVTAEPKGARPKRHAKTIFVIQEHHASRLHWDFRLEADGVLKSWAVPKVPTLDPKVRRLAVHVEDHPLEYAKFHGKIPQGQYGAGHVEIWDKGAYENLSPEPLSRGIEQGRLKFRMFGKKLRGAFALIRMHGDDDKNWLLIKDKDEDARPGSAGQAEAQVQRQEKAAAGKPKKSAKKERVWQSNRMAAKKSAGEAPQSIELTHPQKVMFPEAGITKGDLFNYYQQAADRLLPWLRDRPCTLERLPDGIGQNAPHFWQKNTPDYYPRWVKRAEVLAENGQTVQYVLVNDVATLLYLVNQGTVTFHPFMSRMADLEKPDFVLFDLDRSEATFADVIDTAKAVHAALSQHRRESFVKTSGKSGLHVLVPWEKGDHDEARGWAMEIARAVTEKIPDVATTERSKAARKGRVYLDVMQNAKGRHVVPPYVVRPMPTATVSVPLHWKDVTKRLSPEKFDLKTVLAALKKGPADPMEKLVKGWT